MPNTMQKGKNKTIDERMRAAVARRNKAKKKPKKSMAY